MIDENLLLIIADPVREIIVDPQVDSSLELNVDIIVEIHEFTLALGLIIIQALSLEIIEELLVDGPIEEVNELIIELLITVFAENVAGSFVVLKINVECDDPIITRSLFTS
jgi:hypothetical protein